MRVINMAVIYYGIHRKFIKSHIKEWINITGEPVCFSVKDESLTNFKDKLLLEKYSVVSMDEALKKYPDANVWVTYADRVNAIKAGKRLLKKVHPSKIHFLEANLEYRIGCGRLGRSFQYNNRNISMCTIGNRRRPFVAASGSISQVIAKWKEFSTKLIDANQLGSPNRCFGCPLLKWSFWPKVVKCTNLRFLQDHAKDACNLKCIYCNAANDGRWVKLKTVDRATTHDVIKEFYEMPEYVEMGKEFSITFANGELLVNIYFKEIMEILLKTEWTIELISNLSVYREELSELLRTGRVKHVITSIDAGTRETFKKIKRNDRFDKVVENLHRYPFDKTKLYLKYIFLEGINDNKQDVDGYYAIAKEVGATIQLSADNHTNKAPFTQNEQMRKMVLRLIRKAKADGIRVVADANNINAEDVQFITENYRNAQREVENDDT